MKTIVVTSPGSSLQFKGDCFIDHIRWTGATTAGHQAVINDANGNVFWSSKASATPASPDDCRLQRTVDGGFSVPTLDSGTLLIYIGHEKRNW